MKVVGTLSAGWFLAGEEKHPMYILRWVLWLLWEESSESKGNRAGRAAHCSQPGKDEDSLN